MQIKSHTFHCITFTIKTINQSSLRLLITPLTRTQRQHKNWQRFGQVLHSQLPVAHRLVNSNTVSM